MNRNLMLSGALACALALSACADMSDTQRRTGTGAAIGGAAAGIITGEWGVDLEQLVIQSRAEGVKRLFMCCFLDDDSVMSNIREGGPWAV